MKLISNQINPHFTLRDALWAVSQVRYVGMQKQLDFSSWFGTKNYQLFNAARSALETIIDIVQPPKEKKIAIPAFICGVVAVPFVSRGYEIEWIETDENGCIDIADFRAKSDNVSVLVVPHIFGQVIDLAPFAEICREKNIFLIEDGAHYFEVRGARSENREQRTENRKCRDESAESREQITENKNESLEVRGERAETKDLSAQHDPPQSPLVRGKVFQDENSKKKNQGDLIANAWILSFGREKVISCVSGGALLWPADSPYAEKFASIALSEPSNVWTIKHLFQPLLYALAMPWWGIGGKIIPMLAQKLNLMPKAVYVSEKQGKKVLAVVGLSYAQQRVLEYQLKSFFGALETREQRIESRRCRDEILEVRDERTNSREQRTENKNESEEMKGEKCRERTSSFHKNLNTILQHQKNIASVWQSELKHVFYPQDIIVPESGFRVMVKTDQAQKIIRQLLAQNIHLREWDGVPIAPFGTDLAAFGYRRGSCPRAEYLAQNYITFPTNRHICQKDVKKIVKIIKCIIK